MNIGNPPSLRTNIVNELVPEPAPEPTPPRFVILHVDVIERDASGRWVVTARGAPAAIGDATPTFRFTCLRLDAPTPGAAIRVTWEPA